MEESTVTQTGSEARQCFLCYDSSEPTYVIDSNPLIVCAQVCFNVTPSPSSESRICSTCFHLLKFMSDLTSEYKTLQDMKLKNLKDDIELERHVRRELIDRFTKIWLTERYRHKLAPNHCNNVSPLQYYAENPIMAMRKLLKRKLSTQSKSKYRPIPQPFVIPKIEPEEEIFKGTKLMFDKSVQHTTRIPCSCKKKSREITQCSHCGKKIKRNNYELLQLHQACCPTLKQSEWKCPYKGCGKILAKRLRLRFHIRSVHLRCFTVNCDDCGNTFKSQAILDRHIAYKHNNLREYVCLKCSKSFHTKGNLM